MQDLEHRTGLPDALRVLVEQYPREIWTSHHNFDATTRFWLERHMMFRTTIARISADAEAFLDGGRDEQSFARQNARMMGFLLNQLHGHHHVEDEHYFPLLSGLDQRLTAGFELLDADHHALDAHIHAMADATNAMLRAVDQGAGRDQVGKLHKQLAGFGRFIDRHLEDEEELVIPTILHYAPAL